MHFSNAHRQWRLKVLFLSQGRLGFRVMNVHCGFGVIRVLALRRFLDVVFVSLLELLSSKGSWNRPGILVPVQSWWIDWRSLVVGELLRHHLRLLHEHWLRHWAKMRLNQLLRAPGHGSRHHLRRHLDEGRRRHWDRSWHLHVLNWRREHWIWTHLMGLNIHGFLGLLVLGS